MTASDKESKPFRKKTEAKGRDALLRRWVPNARVLASSRESQYTVLPTAYRTAFCMRLSNLRRSITSFADLLVASWLRRRSWMGFTLSELSGRNVAVPARCSFRY